jgi:hypothetical protein
MLADPVTIAANSPTPQLVLAVVKTDGYGSERVDTGGSGFGTVIVHTPGKNGNRHYVKMTQTKDATNPYSGLTQKQTASVSLSISRPAFGFTDTEMVNLTRALTDFLADSEVTTARIIQMQA